MVKTESKHESKHKSGHSLRKAKKAQPTTETVDDVVPKTRKEAALQRALAAVLAGPGRSTSSSSAVAPVTPSSEPDEYGKGSPTDRLQFGYSPAIAEEAVAYHAHIDAKEWVRQRRANGRVAFVKHQKLPRPNCEPVLSLLKLKNHWSKVSQFRSGLRGDHLTTQDADELLEMLAAKQRVADQSQ